MSAIFPRLSYSKFKNLTLIFSTYLIEIREQKLKNLPIDFIRDLTILDDFKVQNASPIGSVKDL